MTKLEKIWIILQMRFMKYLKELAISEYILCAHSLSGILACKLLKKPIKCQALVAIEPTTKKVMFADFSENPYPEMEEQMMLIEECGPELYFKSLTQATFSPEINKEIWEIMQEKRFRVAKSRFRISDIWRDY